MNQNFPTGLTVYFCGREQCSPGHSFGPAVRPHYLIHIILSGRGIFRHKNCTHQLTAGDAFLITPMESTYYEADQTNPWEYAWIGFDGQNISSLLEDTCFRNSSVYSSPKTGDTGTHLKGLIENILNTFSSPCHSNLTLLGLFLQLLGIMSDSPVSRGDSLSREYVDRALQYMNNNYSYNIRIQDIASAIGIDRTYLYRIFMEQEQISPKQYLIQLRVRTAAGMLANPKYTITEIGYSCGFKDAAAFSSQFRKSTGYTPKQFRKYLKSEKDTSNPL